MTADRVGLSSNRALSAVIVRRYRNFAVGILSGKKAAALRGHVAADVIENVARDGFEKRIARNLKRFQIRDRQLRLVVEHFFEMRDVPIGVNGIAMETAAEVVVHSTGGHFSERELIHLK